LAVLSLVILGNTPPHEYHPDSGTGVRIVAPPPAAHLRPSAPGRLQALVGSLVIDKVPALESTTALKENATGTELSGRALTYDDDRTEKICALDAGRADRC
jgi:hypothetical protein